jgi:hypothetical protein
MIPPVGWISNVLLVSTFSVGHNAAKNLIFRVSSLLLQYTVFKLLSYIAYRLTAYTSFLMLLEDFVQKLYFAHSYGFQKEHSWIVIASLILFPAAGVYDTCLWMFDAPGYIIRSTITNAQSFSQQALPDHPYVLNIPGDAAKVSAINLDRSVSADLYENLTVIATHLPISQEVVAPSQQLSFDVRPRIWLDDQGWSVGLDLGWPMISGNQSCVPNSTDTQQRWSCHFNNTSAGDLYAESFGTHQIWWDRAMTQPNIVSSYPRDNIWSSLGPNGGSAAMTEVFTVTKGQRQHTILQTSWKATMQTTPQLPFQSNEIVDFIRRAWNNDPDQLVTPDEQAIIDEVISAQTQRNSFSTGLMIQEPQPSAIRATVIEYLAIINPTNASDVQFSALRARSINTTLIRSESLSSSKSLEPFSQCPGPFANIATGGQLRGTTCSNQNAGSPGDPGPRSFKGQIDISAVAVLPDIFSNGNTNTSQISFDPRGQSWMRQNQPHLNELMASRAFIGDGIVNVAGEEPVAAISYLQIILVAAPALLAVLSWFLMSGNAPSHYKHSFLAAVCATTHVSDNSCRRIGYMKDPPRIELKTLRRHVVIGTPDQGTLANVGRDQVVAYSMITEPLNLPASTVSQANGAKKP